MRHKNDDDINYTLIWVHEDMLRADHPAFHAADDAGAIFVWDDAYFDQMDYGLNRRVFIYETLLELPVDIYRGDTGSVFAPYFSPQTILTGKTPNPHLKAIMADLRATCAVTTIADAAFVQLGDAVLTKTLFPLLEQGAQTGFSARWAAITANTCHHQHLRYLIFTTGRET